MAWSKPGVTAELAAQDGQECARLAAQQAFLDSGFRGPFFYPGYPFPDRWPHRRSQFYRQQLEFDRMGYELHLQDFCMRARGYELVSVEPQS